MCLGVCQFTMSSAVYNPWTLQQYFLTYGYTAVYASNLGFDEFFFLASVLTTVKVSDYLRAHPRGTLNGFAYLKMVAARYARIAPIYYMIFLIGWQLGPYMGSGPCWYTYEKGFANC